MLLLYLLAILMGTLSNKSQGKLLSETPPSPLFRNESSSSSSATVSALFIMGDSSVDCGENTLFYPLLHHNLSLLPCDGSDSSLLPHLLAKKMGLPNSSPFYNQNGSVEEIRNGLNYGSAQATIMYPGSEIYQSLNQQLRQVLETFQLLQLQLSENSAQHFIESSIFYLSFGKDDYINHFLGNASGAMHKYSGQEFAHILVSQMAHAIRNLYVVNVRKVVCMGILPLGCTPHLGREWHSSTALGGSSCVEEINEIVLQYNTMLEEIIVELNTELLDADIIFCDVYQGIMEIVTNPSLYGFKDAKNACCGLGPHGASIGCLSADMACTLSSDHVWWDLYNPTQAVNSLLADSAWYGHSLSGICRPFPVQELVYPSHSHLN